MKLMIDIPEDRYDEIHSLKFVMYGLQSEENRKLFYRLINAVQDGTPIPDSATNGDVLDKLFPNLTYGTNGEYYHVWSNDGKCTMNIHQDFWNAPYQKGGKE